MSKKELSKSKLQTNALITPTPTLIVNFFPLTHQVSKSSFFAKVPLASNQYPELSLFRQQIKQEKSCSHLQPYTANKKQVYIYKMIFLFFGFLFLFLGSLVLYKTGLLSHSYFNIGYKLIKPIVVMLCSLFAGASFIIACSMRTDKETVQHYLRKSLNQLARADARKKIELGLNRFFYLGKRYRQHAAYSQFYQETKNKIYDQKEEALHLIEKISSSPYDKSEKEILFNQTIAELNDRLMQIVLSFKHSPQHLFHVENF